MTHVVIDGLQFLRKDSTGIGSYARTLASSLRHLGCELGVLYGRRLQARRCDSPIGLAAQVFGNEPTQSPWSNRLTGISLWAGSAVPGRRCLRAVNVPVKGVELSSFEPALPPCDQILNADGIFDRAPWFFSLKGRLIEVRLPDHCGLAHWTGPVAIKARGVPNFYTLHDLIPLQYPHLVIDKGARGVRLHEEIARQADHIITVSESSKQHIMDLLDVDEDRISVTYQPVPPLPSLPREDAERLVEAVYGAKPGRYALFLGAVEPKKNLKRLIEAFLLANVGMPLLIAGPLGWLYDDDLKLLDTIARQVKGRVTNGAVKRCGGFHAQEKDEQPPVRRLGYLPRRHVVALLQCAKFFAFPSIYEGFGLPVVEAMQLGAPVLTSDVGPLREVAGDAAVLVNPLDVAAMAREIRRLSSDDGLEADLRRRGPIQAAKFNTATYEARLAAAYRRAGVRIAPVTVAPRESTSGSCWS